MCAAAITFSYGTHIKKFKLQLNNWTILYLIVAKSQQTTELKLHILA